MGHQLRTTRLLLRPPRLSDARALAAVYADREAARQTKTWPHPVTREYACWRIRMMQESGPDDRVWMILSGRDLIGSIGINIPVGGWWYLGYGIRPDQGGRGFATEAVRAVTAHAFRRLHARGIMAAVFKDNPGSIRVLEKAGFERTGDIGPGWSTVAQDSLPRWGYALSRGGIRAPSHPN